MGAYGPDYEEITRLGISDQKFSQTTAKGDLVSVSCLHFVQDEDAAREFIELVEGLQSYEVNLRSDSTNKEFMAFIRRVTSNYRKIVDTGRGEYKIDFQIELQRTK